MTPECPVITELRRARVARMNQPALVALRRNNAAQLEGALTEFESDWNALEAARQNERETRIATVVLWVALLATIALIGAAAIALSSGALEEPPAQEQSK